MARQHSLSTEMTTEGLLERVRAVVSERWNGNVRAVSRDLKLDYNLVIRVVRDGQVPPTHMLLQLVRVGDVNPAWLLTGAPTTDEGTGPTVPLVDCLPSRPLAELPPPRWIATVPAHPEVAGATVYAYRVRSGDAVIRATGWKIQSGDVLFFDSCPVIRLGVAHPDPRRLVVWRWLGGPDGRTPLTRLGDVRKQDEGYVARVFDCKREGYTYDPTAPANAEPLDCPPAPASGAVLNPDHVAAVMIALTRFDLGLIDLLRQI